MPALLWCNHWRGGGGGGGGVFQHISTNGKNGERKKCKMGVGGGGLPSLDPPDAHDGVTRD